MVLKIDKYNLFLVMLFIIGIIANKGLGFVSYIALAVFVFVCLKNNFSDNYYFILVLIPCIRMFDLSGISMIGNLAILIIALKYIFFEKKNTKYRNAILITTLICVLEVVHWISYIEWIQEEIKTTIMLLIDLLVCCLAVFDNRLQIDNEKMYVSLCNGVMISSLVHILCRGVNSILYVMKGHNRFVAYGHDPNYFSMYTILALFGLVTIGKYNMKNIFRILCLVLLVIMEASKMGFLCLVVILVYGIYIFWKKHKHRRLVIRLIMVGLIIVLGSWNTLVYLIDKIISRFTYGNSVATLSTITSGRFDIVKEYMEKLSDSIINIFFGYGLEYSKIFGILVAHNTFLDVLLSWGIVGIVLVIYELFLFFFAKIL